MKSKKINIDTPFYRTFKDAVFVKDGSIAISQELYTKVGAIKKIKSDTGQDHDINSLCEDRVRYCCKQNYYDRECGWHFGEEGKGSKPVWIIYGA